MTKVETAAFAKRILQDYINTVNIVTHCAEVGVDMDFPLAGVHIAADMLGVPVDVLPEQWVDENGCYCQGEWVVNTHYCRDWIHDAIFEGESADTIIGLMIYAAERHAAQ